MELDALALSIATLISSMKPPHHDKRGDTFWDGQKGCFNFGTWDGLSYCSECFYKNCCRKTSIDWVFVGGEFEKNTAN
jgi:hypothetical protein